MLACALHMFRFFVFVWAVYKDCTYYARGYISARSHWYEVAAACMKSARRGVILISAASADSAFMQCCSAHLLTGKTRFKSQRRHSHFSGGEMLESHVLCNVSAHLECSPV